MSTPAITLNSSPARWMEDPMPAEPKVSLPGDLRASRTRSATPFSREAAGTTRMFGVDATMPIGIRSRSQS